MLSPFIKFPILKADISLEPSKFKVGGEEIERFIIEERFFTKYTYIDKGSEAIAGEKFIFEHVKPPLDDIFLNPILAFSNAFKSSGRSIKFNQTNYIVIKLVRLAFTKAFKATFKAVLEKIKRRVNAFEAKENFLKAINEWGDMLKGKDFHGGEKPDHADFVLYATLKSKMNARAFKRYIEKEFPRSVNNWIIRMDVKCRHDHQREFIL